jgi:hypothetical protein
VVILPVLLLLLLLLLLPPRVGAAMNPFEIEGDASLNRVNGGGEGPAVAGGGGSLHEEYGEVYDSGSDDDDDEHHSFLPQDDDDAGEEAPFVNGSSPNSNGRTYRDDVNGENGSSRPRRARPSSSAADALAKSNDSLCKKGSALILLLLAGGAALRHFLPAAADGWHDSRSPALFDNNGTDNEDGVVRDPDRPVPVLDLKARKAYTDVKLLRKKFAAARDAYVKRLHREYGPDNVERMFVIGNMTVGRLALRSPGVVGAPTASEGNSKPEDMGVSWSRLRRKILMKLLQVRILASNGKAKTTKGIRMPTFIWASGGHSAAAAHGDLYNESYSAVLERAVQPVLAELGVWFEGRNYAMGGTASGPEVALCHTPIFGTNIDVLSWDFGMTDGAKDVGSMEMYFRQAAYGPSRPACVAMEIQSAPPQRIRVMRHLEDSGVPAFYVPVELVKAVFGAIPETFGLNETQIQAMPPYVRSFKCEGSIEKGEPGCAEAKWTPVKPVCAGAKYRTSWHPGWYGFFSLALALCKDASPRNTHSSTLM